jgi:hypothetical protein
MAQINSFKAQLTPSRIQGGKGERQGNKTSEERMRKKYEEAPSWKKKKPEDITEPHIEGGRTYYWCTKCSPCTSQQKVNYLNATIFIAKTAHKRRNQKIIRKKTIRK